jgi:phosphoribosylformylglycinamidine synthase
MDKINRIYVEKKEDYSIEAKNLLKNLKENLNIKKLNSTRILNRYDISGITEEEFRRTIRTIFSEPPVDMVYNEEFKIEKNEIVFAIEYLPGQYDQRADSAAQCIQITTKKSKPIVRTAKVYVLKGDLTKQEILKIKKYLINPVDSRELKY